MPPQNFKFRKMSLQNFDFVKYHSKSHLLRKLPPLPNYYTFLIKNKQNLLYFEWYFCIFHKYPHPFISTPLMGRIRTKEMVNPHPSFFPFVHPLFVSSLPSQKEVAIVCLLAEYEVPRSSLQEMR